MLRWAVKDIFWPVSRPYLQCTDQRFRFLNLHHFGKPGVLLVMCADAPLHPPSTLSVPHTPSTLSTPSTMMHPLSTPRLLIAPHTLCQVCAALLHHDGADGRQRRVGGIASDPARHLRPHTPRAAAAPRGVYTALTLTPTPEPDPRPNPQP